jgi:hypothetical protein
LPALFQKVEIERKKQQLENLAEELNRLESDRKSIYLEREAKKTELSELKNERIELERSLKRPLFASKALTDEEKKKEAEIKGKMAINSEAQKPIQRSLRELDQNEGKIEEEIRQASQKISAEKEQLNKMEIEYQQTSTFENVTSISEKLLKDTYIRAEEHNLAAEDWGQVFLTLGLLSTVLAAIAGASIFTNVPQWITAAGVISLAVTVITGVATFLNGEQKSTVHFNAGVGFLVLSNQSETFLDIDLKLKNVKNVEELAKTLKQLTDRRDELIKNSPRVSNRYHEKAEDSWKKWNESRHPALEETELSRHPEKNELKQSINTAAKVSE